ncbi:S-adenosyl-L-methionine-dependent methyltransferase [Xylariomycetidae sp. FL2044]|nr:S-adenosyl-L-methionine-dependent methyltransferase [Xylariomycetidae sp. FL2044]
MARDDIREQLSCSTKPFQHFYTRAKQLQPWDEEDDGDSVTDHYSYVAEDGRTYHGYMPGEYMLPNDLEEQRRLDFSHAIYRLILNNRLAVAPIRSPECALDIGTGTGIWALEFAEENPTTRVIGTDLSLIQPLSWTPNCELALQNSETDDWNFSEPLDYVHLRGVLACFHDVRTIIDKSLKHLASGGWIEFQDGCFDLQAAGEESFEGTCLQRWNSLIRKCGRLRGSSRTENHGSRWAVA